MAIPIITTGAKCRFCGCTEAAACMTGAGPCFWMEEDLCSGCWLSPGSKILDALTVFGLESSFGIQTTIGQAYFVIVAVQVACRHPNFKGPHRKVAEEFARDMQRHMDLPAKVRAMLDSGWENPTIEIVDGTVNKPGGPT